MIEIVAGETTDVEFDVVSGKTVHGRIIDFAGRPVAGAQIWLGDGTGMPRDGQIVTRSAADGTFTIDDVPPGTYTLEIWHEALGSTMETVTVTGGETTDVRVELAQSSR